MSTTTADPTAAGAPDRRPARPAPNPLRAVLRPLASLQLTVALFVLAVLLVFFGTLAQKNAGIWTVVDRYFWSWVVMVDAQLLVQFGQIFFNVPKDWSTSLSFPLPGGKLLGGLMFVNLLAAHALRFRLTWKRSGIFILHAGILLLFVGEFITREFQVEQQMPIAQGQTRDFSIDSRNYELAFVDGSNPDTDRVTVVPAKLLRQAARDGNRVSSPDLPVDVQVLKYMANSELLGPHQEEAAAADNPATAGSGRTRVAVERPEVSGVDQSNSQDFPAAYVRFFKKGTDEQLGTYLVSLDLPDQSADLGGKAYEVSLRHVRYYKPFSLKLLEFRFDRYMGTNTPKNYSSRLRLIDPQGEDREVTISMNEPLRYRGETFYQSGFTPDEKGTILQVVRNPGWMLPYLACFMVSFGMALHFVIFLSQFLYRRFSSDELRSRSGSRVVPLVAIGLREVLCVLLGLAVIARVLVLVTDGFTLTRMDLVIALLFAALVGASLVASRLRAAAGGPAARRPLVERLIPWAAVGLAVLYVLPNLFPRSAGARLDLREAARLPVVDGGRVKPLDTVARVDLRLITGREEFTDTNDKTRPAIQWFFDAASAPQHDPGPAGQYKVFRIENDRVLELLNLKRREGLRYSVDEMRPRFKELDDAAKKARARPEKEWDLFDAKVVELRRHLERYLEIWQGHAPLLLPPAGGQGDWRTVAALQQGAFDEAREKVREQLRAKGLPTDPAKMTKEQQDELVEAFEAAIAEAGRKDPVAAAWQDVLAAYRSGKQKEFDAAVAAYRAYSEKAVAPADLRRARFETYLNDTALYYHCVPLYILAALLSIAGWIGLLLEPAVGRGFLRASFRVLLLTFAVHAFTLFSRMYLMDRPLVFVTNLYSSAVFIGWVGVGVGLIVERVFPIGLGNIVGAVLGLATSIIAHNLAASGDTLEMMQAVLDTNFWLATHVTCVTFGYAATYVAGLVGLIYLTLGLFTNTLRTPLPVGPGGKPMELGRVIGMVLYGVVCFATLLSFTGTVLGGIWADQSWGRFWGWDPKENGAVLIVIWNALILHARWAGLVKDRGMAVLALVGNMITTWSWFGTNQLGVGLHAYGFNNALAFGCMVTWVAHASVIAGVVGWMLYERYALPKAMPVARRA